MRKQIVRRICMLVVLSSVAVDVCARQSANEERAAAAGRPAAPRERDKKSRGLCGPTHPHYRAGLQIGAGKLTVKVLSAEPAPPRQRVPNAWVVEVSDANGKPLEGARVSNADTFMAIHNHSGATVPRIEKLIEPGRWKLDGLDFKMRGPWEVLFEVTPQGAAESTHAMINVCVE